MKYRFQWTFPILISPHDHNRVYVGSQYVHLSTDAGHSWQVISPDLSGNDPEKLKITGGITVDDVSPLVACTLFALADAYQTDMGHELSSNSFGLGARINLVENLDIELGTLFISYNNTSKPMFYQGISYNESYSRKTTVFSVGLGYRF